MGHLRGLGWHFRMRIKSTFWIYPSHLAPFQVGEIALNPGHLSCWQEVSITDKHFGPVHWAVARPLGSDESWYVVSDEAAAIKTLEEYGVFCPSPRICAALHIRGYAEFRNMQSREVRGRSGLALRLQALSIFR